MKDFTRMALILAAGVGVALSIGNRRGESQVRSAATSETDTEVAGLVQSLLSSPQADARQAALEWMARDARARDANQIEPVFRALNDSDAGVRRRALENLGWIYERERGGANGGRALAAIQKALEQTSDRTLRLTALDLLRGAAERGEYDPARPAQPEGALIAEPVLQALVASLLADSQASLRPELLRVVAASRTLQTLPAVIDAVGRALDDENLTVRSDSGDILIAIYEKGDPAARERARPILLAALAQNDPNVQRRVSKALGMPVPPPRPAPAAVSLSGERVSTADVPLDFNYYTAFVQPLFRKKYGNEACVDCHTPGVNSTGAFRILAPGADGRYSLEESRVNFVSILPTIDVKDADKSRLLLKPLNPRAPEGSLRGETHDGGVFWDTQYDRDFEMVRNWVHGAKLETPPDKQLDFAYFVEHVEPIFATPASDGIACINCHSTHAILHLESPETREGQFSVEQLANNYQAAHRVIDEFAPASSFIVRKPTSPREGEPGGLSHAGGIRWPDKKDSWQYRTLIMWMGMMNLALR